MRTRWFAVLTVFAASVAVLLEPPGLAAQARGASGASFTIAVLRRDGIVIPVASYDRGRWANRWPPPGRRVDIPIRVGDSPAKWWDRGRPIATWTAWPLRGESRVIHVTSPVNLTVECQSQVGLQTDYVSSEPPAPPPMQPFPKDGLATSSDALVEPVRLLDQASPEWQAVSGIVDAQVASEEAGLLRQAHLQALVPDKARVGTAFALEVLFATAGLRPGTTVLYFEGVKRYAPEPGPPAGLLTFVTGVIRFAPGERPQVDVRATLSDGRREGLLYTMVLGALRVDDHLYWVVQRSAWGYERFEVIDLRPEGDVTVLVTEGGICQ